MDFLKKSLENCHDTQVVKYAEEYHGVDGWGINDYLFALVVQLDFLQKQWDIWGSTVEIGVHHGKTFILLCLLSRKGEKNIAIDLFEEAQHLNIDNSGEGNYPIFMKNLKKYIRRNSDLVTIKKNTLHIDKNEILNFSKGKNVRLIHVDGGHYKEIVANDLQLAQDTLCDGGVIIVDDFWHSGFPGVQEGVHHFFSTSTAIKICPFLTGSNKLFLTTHCFHDRYILEMKKFLPENRQKIVSHFGYKSLCIDQH